MHTIDLNLTVIVDIVQDTMVVARDEDFLNLGVKREPDGFAPNYPQAHIEAHNFNELLNIGQEQQQPLAQNQHGPQQQQQQKQSEEQLSLNMPSQIVSTDFPGEAVFEVYISPHHGKKSPWMYSGALGKIFIAMNEVFPVDFKCHFPNDGRLLYVRATPVFSDTQHKNQLVTRCINHAHEREKTNEGCTVGIRDHIIRCSDRHSSYGGSKANRQHLYVRVPLQPPPPGSDSRQLHFQFMCKNSCSSSSGMNRRAIEVVFTLESEAGEILGRRVLKVRICSCPKRDKETEEKAHYQKEVDQPQVKKRKLEKKHSAASQELPDTKVLKLEVSVPRSIAHDVLRAMHGVLASEMVRGKGDQSVYKKCMDEIQQKMDTPHE